MNDTHTDRPNGGDVFTVRGLHAYFTLWLTNLERFYEERDKRYGEKFAAQDEKTTLALSAAEKAITKAEMATEKRFDAVNEFRGTLSDQAATLMPRVEAEGRFKALEEKIDDLRAARSENTGAKAQSQESRTQNQWLIGLLIAAIPTALLLGDLLFRKGP